MIDEGPRDPVEEGLRESFLLGLAGDSAAYDQLLRMLANHLRAYFRRRLSSAPDEAEDLVQETLLAVHTKRHTYDRGQLFTVWVYAIAKYKLIDFLRRHARTQRRTDSLDQLGEDVMALFSASDTEAAAAQRDLAMLLDQLPDRQRLPIVYTKLDGLSVAETASATGMSESAVKVSVHRGLKALAARIRGKE